MVSYFIPCDTKSWGVRSFMSIHEISHVAVVGAGQMGRQIAMLSALGGLNTMLMDTNPSVLVTARDELEDRMNHWVIKEKLTPIARVKALARLTATTSLESAVAQADVVIEAVVEKLALKRKIFAQLDSLAPRTAILATNSSTIASSQLGSQTTRPEKVLNMHFFFPPLQMTCVEIVRGPKTSDETVEMALALCQRIGQTGILVQKEIPGFVANRILGAIEREALALYEAGIADFKDIDLICRQALHHPIGPFEIMDLSGNDVTYLAMQQIYEETGDPYWKPPATLVRKLEEGLLGRKTGTGWYLYSEDTAPR